MSWPQRAQGWRAHLTLVGGLALAVVVLFHHDAIDMARIWWTSSTYGHCLFIPPLIGWLVWQRAGVLAQLDPATWGAGLAWLAGGALLWLLGDAASLGVLRHGGLIVMLQGVVAASLGPQVTRGLLFPLFYAFFLVPVGSELEPALQLLTAKMAMGLLGLVGIPAHIEGVFITTPTGYFKVAEACSGAKFVVAMAAYGVLVCHLCFRSWMRRAVFLVAALVACVLANGVRAFGTIWIAHERGIETAVGVDHVVWGWLFFAVVMAAVMLIAWPFFDRRPGEHGLDAAILRRVRTRAGGALTLTAGLALGLMAAGPAWSHVSALVGAKGLARIAAPDVRGWRRAQTPMAAAWAPHFADADQHFQARFADGRGHIVDLALIAYDRQTEGRELIGFGQGAVDPAGGWAWTSPAWAPGEARGEIITAPGPVRRHVVSFYRVGVSGMTGSAARIKLDTMTARLLMRDQRAIAILVSAEDREGAPAEEAIRAFLKSLGHPQSLADAIAPSR
ncbi:MAG: EpsI family protein [Sphingobium sp.]|jgi:exosortase A|nr:EpsI family protein [Sphingobium sp.]MCI1272110.1 EpsI family protein [Sphingobium sp.]MCI1755023.1 EpsI family protein [Sphingobium sp.]MCI2051773.1 EpsI family protein [Sphingobium sp.]